MAPAGSYGKAPSTGARRVTVPPVDEQRLDPGLRQLTACAAPPEIPTYLIIGLPICFTIALGIMIIGFRGALTLESLALLTLGVIGLIFVRYLDRRS